MTAQNKRFLNMVLGIPLLLAIPFVAMRFSGEVNWTLGDFIVAGGLLLGLALVIEAILRVVTQRRHRILLFVVVFVLFVLLWAELAVGVFGTPFGGS
ncbi:MAG: hypothetical protein AAFZ63_02075 [Bacteroidota bacterium]